VDALGRAAPEIAPSTDAMDLLFGSLGALANHDPARLDGAATRAVLGLGLGLLAQTAAPHGRVALAPAAAAAACVTLATLLQSRVLFGATAAAAGVAANHSAAVSVGLDQLASSTLVARSFTFGVHTLTRAPATPAPAAIPLRQCGHL
jgi:hypothetical protein